MADPARCDKCSSPSITVLRYSGQHLCGDHHADSVEHRVKRELKRQGGLPKGRILVAYSGGKDSTTALHLVLQAAQRLDDVEIVALTVDEGIAAYRPEGLAIAREETRRLGIEHIIRRTEDLSGAPMDEIQAQRGGLGACSYCGVFRRRIMNDAAREIGATRLVTGHNLDDTAQAILMNLTTADLEKLARLGPHATPKPGLVPRLLPLRTIPESEVYLYALHRGLRWHDEECPYAEHAARGLYRDILYRLESARPGTRHALLRTLDGLRPLLEREPASTPLTACVRCGEPASGTLCKACEFRENILRVTVAGTP